MACRNKECRTAEIGCLDCKGLLADALVARLTPIWEKRRELVQKPKLVDEWWVASQLPSIAADAHKGARKKVVIVGGASGMAGAAILAAQAALRNCLLRSWRTLVTTTVPGLSPALQVLP